jgi:hypothetical protein
VLNPRGENYYGEGILLLVLNRLGTYLHGVQGVGGMSENYLLGILDES